MTGIGQTMIEGVNIIPLQQFHDYRGKVMKMANDLESGNYGEIYFSTVHPGIVKGWHLHKQMQLNYACIYGKILLVLIDARETSPTHKNMMEIYISPENYGLVQVPPMILNAFKGLGTTDSIVANLSTLSYTDDDIERFPLEKVEYDWFPKGK